MSLSDRARAANRFLRDRHPSIISRHIRRLYDAGRLALLLCCGAATMAHAQTSTCANTTTTPPMYYYDAGGRLSAVMDATGKTSNYNYDLAGNILSITQNPSSTFQILQVCPNQAPVGSAVTIWGTGFSTGASVAFGKAAASSVNVISPNQIIATVPSGARGVAVNVTSSSGTTVSSASTFNVGSLPPQITGISGGTTVAGYAAFNPFPFYDAASGADATGALSGSAAGTQSLTISGTGFDTTMPLVSTKNKVWIGTQTAQITSASFTSLTVNVPISGSIIKNGSVPAVTVSTPSGTATYSSQSLLIAPAGVSPYLMNVKSAGTSPASTNLCGLDTSEIDAVSDALAIGSSQSLTFSAGSTQCAGQATPSLHYVAYLFAGTAGSTINAQVSVCASGATNCGPNGTSGFTNNSVLLVAPDGSEVDAADLGGSYQPVSGGSTQEFYKLPQTGTYTIYVQNQSAGGSATSQVSLNSINPAQSLGSTSIGSSVSATVTAFQAASFTFNVPANSNGRVTLLTTLASSAGSPFVVSVIAPDGFTSVYSNQAPAEGDTTGFLSPGQVDFSGPISVPATAAGKTYTVTYQSLSSNSTSVTFALAQLPSDVTVTGCTGALPQPGATAAATISCPAATISAPGQGISANFGGSAIFSNNGSNPTFIGALQTSATNSSGCYEVLLTDTGLQQQFYRSVQCGSGDFSYAVQFPNGSVGPYVAQAFGIGQNTGNFQFTFYASPPLPPAQIPFNPNKPATATIASPGQSQFYIITNGTPGSWISLNAVGQAGWAQCFSVAIKSKGNPFPQAFGTYLSCPSGPTGSLSALQLPAAVSNTYNILLTPAGSQAGTISLSATSTSAAPSGTIPINGDVYTVLSSSMTSYSYTYAPSLGAGSYADVVTVPNIVANQVNPSKNCYEVTIAQTGASQLLFDSAGQTNGYQVGNNLQCSGTDVAAPPLANPLVSSGQGTVAFSLNNASQTSSGSYSQTLYNYSTNAFAATLTPAAGGPAGVVLSSTLPAQPVAANFKSASPFVNVYVGVDAALAANCMVVTVNDLTRNGKQVATKPTCEPAIALGAILLPTQNDTYQVIVQPQGNAVGNVSIGVGTQ